MLRRLLLAAALTVAAAPAFAQAISLGEISAYLKAGIDGFFTDDPAIGRAALHAT